MVNEQTATPADIEFELIIHAKMALARLLADEKKDALSDRWKPKGLVRI